MEQAIYYLDYNPDLNLFINIITIAIIYFE